MKRQLEHDLQNRINKVIWLEFKHKAQTLEMNLEQIHAMYQNVTSDRSILKVDLQVAQRKLARKEEKIVQLEKSFMASKQKQQDYLTIIK